MSIADEITRLQTAKANIKSVINNKGGSLTTETISSYAEKIDELPAVVELTQEEYDELESYDNNTYYLIVEEE